MPRDGVGDGMLPVQPLDDSRSFADTGRPGTSGCTITPQRQGPGEGLVGCNNLLAQLDDVIAHPEDKNGMGSFGKQSPKSSCTMSWTRKSSSTKRHVASRKVSILSL